MSGRRHLVALRQLSFALSSSAEQVLLQQPQQAPSRLQLPAACPRAVLFAALQPVQAEPPPALPHSGQGQLLSMLHCAHNRSHTCAKDGAGEVSYHSKPRDEALPLTTQNSMLSNCTTPALERHNASAARCLLSWLGFIAHRVMQKHCHTCSASGACLRFRRFGFCADASARVASSSSATCSTFRPSPALAFSNAASCNHAQQP